MQIQFGGSVTYSGEALKNRQLNLSSGEYILASTLQSSKLNHTLKERLVSVKEHIESAFHQEHSLKALARANGLNEYDLKKYFKILFGKTVFELIRETRLIEAKKMIIDQQLSISEITHQVGYKSTQHFSTAFKKKFGYSPSTLFKGGAKYF